MVVVVVMERGRRVRCGKTGGGDGNDTNSLTARLAPRVVRCGKLGSGFRPEVQCRLAG